MTTNSDMFLLSLVALITISVRAQTLSYYGEVVTSEENASYPDVLPRDEQLMAVGYDATTDTILIIGGSQSKQSASTFNLTSMTFTDEGTNYLPATIFGNGQFYSQMGDTLWMVDENGEDFYAFHTELRLVATPTGFTIPNYVGWRSCLTTMENSLHQYLLVAGSNDYSQSLQVYNLSASYWILNTPTLLKGRRAPSCVAHQFTMYAICGSNDRTIEYLEVGEDVSFTGKSWQYTVGELSYSVRGCRSVVHKDDIVIFGGFEGSYFPTNIDVLSTVTGRVNSGGNLAYGIWGAGVIVVRDTVYIFGGKISSNVPVDTYQYFDILPTSAPTAAPTNAPSVAPSVAPTAPPSQAPSAAPSWAPTTAPSRSPSSSPTETPSFSPTRYPTITDAYNSYINVVYGLSDLLDRNVLQIVTDAETTMSDIERLIERGYVEQNNILLGYRDFYCNIQLVDGYNVPDIDGSFEFNTSSPLELTAKIFCNREACVHIASAYDRIQLETTVSAELRKYFDDSTDSVAETVTFSVIAKDTVPEWLFDTLSPTTSTTTAAPTANTDNPTKAPTANPSRSPTNAPSASPTGAPTDAPSFSPTRYPTETDPYDAYFNVLYRLSDLLPRNNIKIAADATNTLIEIERLVENGYVVQDVVGFREFYCQIETVNGYAIQDIPLSEITATSLDLGSKIFCNEPVCKYLIAAYKKTKFEPFVTVEVRQYFDGTPNGTGAAETATFTVVSMDNQPSSLISTTAINEQTDLLASISAIDFWFYGSIGLTFVFFVLGLLACCYNDGVCFKFPRMGRCCRTVDDGKFAALIVFGLHIYDFTSDINLCLEMWFTQSILSMNSADFHNLLLFICGIGSIVFIVVPYVVNLWYAAKIKDMIPRDNEFAKSFFDNYSKAFSSLVVLTGGCYASLSLVSSRCFGLTIFDSGLTPYELRHMRTLRIVNLLFENMPQIVIQLLYAIAIGKMSEALIFALIASLLSVLSTVMAVLIDRDGSNKDTYVVKYYLVMTCRRSLEARLSADERLKININKGKRRQLTDALARLFGIPRKNIQIGAAITADDGLIMRMLQFVYHISLDQGESTKSPSAKVHVQTLYQAYSSEINSLFSEHFGLRGDFAVEYQTDFIRNRLNDIVNTPLGRNTSVEMRTPGAEIAACEPK